MNALEACLAIGIMALCTFVTRAFPFALFGRRKEVPDTVRYLGGVLPPAIMGTLIIYCLKGIRWTVYPGGLAELLAVALVGVIHIWKRNTLLSIAGGTLFYMVLVQLVLPS